METKDLLKRTQEALEKLLNVSHRLAGCAIADCVPCAENQAAVTLAREVLEELRAANQ